ncbi:MAG TPA: winged helix-turn-helix transcriptional regulator [Candidatus Intestinimonas pullistercoris]|uniref:Winged helix-turn-helix transcriptional regulator n=1 Tax=Candidatus Intestinimonas pullistercoris TaxID=2838623 RepID=A0A9D2T189_9FIRM|nr:winged helix-turn-helix transcriptional regulator [Candidatus Intestinimonas pullistercoris]
MTQREAQILQWIQENPMISQQELADKAGITRSSAAVHISNLMKKGYIAGKGYIIRTAPYAVVVGGVNLDIGGTPFAPLVGQDSNPGRVRTSLGGVGRNIAHNMALLGLDVRLITALGDDLNAQKITTSCIELGIDLAPSLQVPGGTTSTYLFLTNEKGDMALAVSDMEIYDHLTPRYLSTKEQLLNNARLVVCDTNIPAETLQWIAENCRAPVFVDPVSTAKAGKVKPVLGRLHTLKPNRIEAELLSGVAITDDKSLSAAADALLATGLHRVFISLGGEGVYAADHLGGRIKVPCGPARMVNTTGCGDAFMAALAWGWLEGLGLEEAARAGLAASAIAMEGAETINPEMSAAALRRRLDLLPPAGPSEGRDAL